MKCSPLSRKNDKSNLSKNISWPTSSLTLSCKCQIVSSPNSCFHFTAQVASFYNQTISFVFIFTNNWKRVWFTLTNSSSSARAASREHRSLLPMLTCSCLYFHVFECSAVTFPQLSMTLSRTYWNNEPHADELIGIAETSLTSDDRAVRLNCFALLCLTDRSQSGCSCSCNAGGCRKPSAWSSQDGRHLWLWPTRELPQHWHRGQPHALLVFGPGEHTTCVVVVVHYYLIINSLFCCGCAQAELTFSAGDIIHVFGDMDEDGFFYVSVNWFCRAL